jgi:asparaginyl-tRNA synthetase
MGISSDSLPVQVDLFGVKTYLADSMQFMLEYGCRIFPKGTYYMMPSFRGEDADERHLCQFYHSEAEIPGGLQNVIYLVNDYIRYLCKGLLITSSDEIRLIAGKLSHLERVASGEKFPQITFDEAMILLNTYAKDNNLPIDQFYKELAPGIRTFTNSGEKVLIELHNGIVWVTHYDYGSVPFYQKYLYSDKSKALNADLLFGIGEVVGAGERHETSRDILEGLRTHDVSRETYEWYVKLKENYPMKTSGFGMGIERFILWVFDHDDIRDCQLVPRFNGIDVLP